MITQKELKSRLSYDPLTGHFTWLNGKNTGKHAGSIMNRGYVFIKLDGQNHLAHRLAYLYMFGTIPVLLDHENRVRDDNRLSNIRVTSRAQNAANLHGPMVTNKSGHQGVAWYKAGSKWRVQIVVAGKKQFLGYFHDKEEAAEVYRKAHIKAHGKFSPYHPLNL